MFKNIDSLGIIPARYASSRFPGKPLVDIQGKTMIQRVYEQAVKSKLDQVIVATDDQRIFDHIKDSNGRVVMTSSFHKSGTDRCAEVASLAEYKKVKWIVNIQGDEPFIDPAQINTVLRTLVDRSTATIATLAKKITDSHQLFDENIVKVVLNKKGKACYFSRSTIPYLRGVAKKDWVRQADFYKHLGIYGFAKNVLLDIAQLAQSKMEMQESLEQLRWLDHGYAIDVAITDKETFGIDVPSDLNKLPTLE